MPAARRQARVSNKQPVPRALSGLLEVLTTDSAGRAGQGRAGPGRAGPGRAGQGRAGQGLALPGRAGQGRAEQGRAGQGRAGQPPQPTQKKHRSWVWGPSLLPNGREVSSATAVLVYGEALPSLTVLTGRSAQGLGRSLERPCKWSAALSAVSCVAKPQNPTMAVMFPLDKVNLAPSAVGGFVQSDVIDGFTC